MKTLTAVREQAPAAPPAGDAPARRPRRSLAAPGAIAAYAACAVVQYHAVLARLDTAIVAGADGALFAWWIRWLPHAIVHGYNPFITHAINAPFGANAMWNTSVPLLSLLASPITLTAGPVVATNLLFVGAPVASAVAAFFVLRRYTDNPFAAFVGGLMFGFSPFIATLHLHLMWALLPALLIVFLDEIFVRQRYSPARLGALLGVTCVAQLLISSETLASAAVVAAVAVVVMIVVGRAWVRAHLPHAAKSLAIAVLTFTIVGSWPLYVLLFGPQRVSSEIQPAGHYVADLLEFFVPGPRQAFGPSAAARIYSSFSGNMSEHSAYLGIPLLAVLVAIAVRRWRRPVVRVTAITTLVTAILSLGPHLTIHGVVHKAIPLPWALVQRAPFLNNVLPARLSVYVMMGAAVLVATELSELSRRRGRRRLIPGALVLLALVPLVPVPRYPASLGETPALFARDGDRIAEGTTLVVEPYAHPGNANAMLWQARAGIPFAMPGGYVITQSPGRRPAFWPPSTPLRNVSIMLEKGEPPVLTEALRRMLLTELRDLGACAVVIGPHPHRATAVSYFVELLGRIPGYEAGVWVFDLECGDASPERQPADRLF